ncbi:MAG: thiol-disulfide isomerase [Acidobacteriota bacterium]|nr:thiol-disulfide isomerase [Acidobacteriota bacterium]
MIASLLAGTLALAAESASVGTPPPVTFNKDVLPVLQKNCQGCHRPGQIAPMSFLTYESARPWAKAMKAAVLSKQMPPWGADPSVGHFTNDRSLKQSELDTIAKWADSGAPQGDPKDAPAPIQWPADGWQIKPDVVVQGPRFDVPASGIIEWKWVVIPSPFKEDTWVNSIEIRPSNVAVTHHTCLALGPHKPETVYGKVIWQNKPRDANGDEIDERKGRGGSAAGVPKGPAPPPDTVAGVLAGTNGIEECYEPGRPPADYRPYHAAKLIPAGTDIAINYHFTPIGTPVTGANIAIGFTLAKEPPQFRYLALSASAPQDHARFAIPPNNPNWESPPADVEFTRDVTLVGLMPHMHLRGKQMSFELTYPDGRKERVLNVPHYDFNWQIWYDTWVKIPKGTKMHIVAHYDNSANNKFNPNPNKTVYYGDMTWDEMMAPAYGLVVEDKSVDQKMVIK